MLFRLRIAILLRHAEIDDMNDVCGLCAGPADEEVVGFDIAVYKVLLVNRLHPGKLDQVSSMPSRPLDRAAYRLLGNHNHRLDGEAPVAVIEKVLQTWSKQVDDKDVMEAVPAKVIDIRNAS